MDPLFEKTGTPYQYAYQNPVKYVDPTGMIAEPPSDGKERPNGTIWNDNDGTWVYNNGVWEGQNGASNIDASKELNGIVVTASRNESSLLDRANFINDRFGDGASILGSTKNQGGSFRLTNGTYNGNNFDPKYYSSNWKGGSRAKIKTYNVSRTLGRASLGVTIVLSTIELGEGINKDYQTYQSEGYTNGRNTAVASAKVGVGIAAGWAAGAATGAAVGTFVPIPIVGTVAGAVVGGFVGYFAGELAGELTEEAYERY